MTILPSGFFDKYHTYADALIEEVNATPVVLHMKSPELSDLTNNFSDAPYGLDFLGGRVPVFEQDTRLQEEDDDKKQGIFNINITARIYWNPKNYEMESYNLKVVDNKNYCKMITYSVHEQNIKNAVNATINGKSCTLIGDPAPHGMGNTKKYITCFWEVGT